MNLETCLPRELQGPATTITPMAAGLSGAGVYRVDAAGSAYALKVSDESEPVERWRGKVHIQQMAANTGLAPRIFHVNTSRRAVLSEFVTDQSFPALFGNPLTRDAALVQLGRTIRHVHDLPLPADASCKDPRDLLSEITNGLDVDFVVPAFVADAIRWGLTQEPPAADRAEVLSHNDVNPSNLVYDGESLMLLDWEVAGRNDPYYDLAAVAVFLRMDAETCRKLIEIHDAAPVATLPERFIYVRRLVATLVGAMLMRLARASGHGGAKPSDTLESVSGLAESYQAMRIGTISLATGDGKLTFGMALIKASTGF